MSPAGHDQRAALRAFLAAEGPARATDAMAHLGLTQATFSRLVQSATDSVLMVGRARSTRYLASREIDEVGRSVAVFEIDEAGASRQAGKLHAVLPGSSFYFEAATEDSDSGRFDDLPYFLDDLRPAGFLGRLVPRQHPELALPGDIQLWTAGQTLIYLTRFGWNLSGNFIVGEPAFHLHLQRALAPPHVIAARDRAHRYAQLADDVLSLGVPGSSAAGEQPKFLVNRAPGPAAVLVKFSPPATDATSRRAADLLIAEAHALETLRAHGHAAARGEVIEAGDRVFLEVERFDRLPGGGRRGLISLRALDSQFVGRARSWTDTVADLARQRIVEESVVGQVHWRHLFGKLIANTDMHGGNLSFFSRGTRIVGLAPAYDLAPALYAAVQGHLRTPVFETPVPEAADAPHWTGACAAARDFWSRVAGDARVSKAFRQVARQNATAVAHAQQLQRLLPAASG
jgi:hypothetical protein